MGGLPGGIEVGIENVDGIIHAFGAPVRLRSPLFTFSLFLHGSVTKKPISYKYRLNPSFASALIGPGSCRFSLMIRFFALIDATAF